MLKRFTPILVMIAICWIVFIADAVLTQGQLRWYGIVPRQPGSLPAVLWSPFVHGSLTHLTANTFPLLVLGAVICARSRDEFASVTAAGILAGGLLIWVFGRNASHIGASGLIFCYFGYVVSLAWFQRTPGTLVLSILCILLYGGMITGLLPTSAAVSWEGHAAGFVVGIASASMTRKSSGRALRRSR